MRLSDLRPRERDKVAKMARVHAAIEDNRTKQFDRVVCGYAIGKLTRSSPGTGERILQEAIELEPVTPESREG